MEIENLDFDTKVRKPSFLVAEEKKIIKKLNKYFCPKLSSKKIVKI